MALKSKESYFIFSLSIHREPTEQIFDLSMIVLWIFKEIKPQIR